MIEVYGTIPKRLWKTGVYFIAKYQKSFDRNPQVMIYDKSGKWKIMMPYQKDLKKVFGDEMKVYASVCFTKDGTLYLDEVVEEQEW